MAMHGPFSCGLGDQPSSSIDELRNSLYEEGNDKLMSLIEEANKSAKANDEDLKPCIQMVPLMLRKNGNIKKYFEPRLMAFGPIHHKKDTLKLGETIKQKVAGHFASHHGYQGATKLYRNLVANMEEIRQCFAMEVIKDYDDKQLAWMMFIDGCAILQCILWFAREEEIDFSVIKIHHLVYARMDILLLENQIPFLVLRLLMGEKKIQDKCMPSIDLFIKSIIMVSEAEHNTQEGDENYPTHLLDLLRKRLLQNPHDEIQQVENENLKESKMISMFKDLSSRMVKCWKEKILRKPKEPIDNGSTMPQTPRVPPQSQNCIVEVWRNYTTKCRERMKRKTLSFRNVKELKEAGIFFKRSKTSHFTDISFSSKKFFGVLKLPPIVVDDSTAPLLMNLIAYEMCPDFTNDFGVASYACFLDNLIDQPEDAAELRKAKIIINCLGSDEILAKVFNDISTDLVPNPYIYKTVNDGMQVHCNMKWRTWMAQAYHQYFSSPWTFLAFAGAVTALILSGIQTQYTVYSPPGPCDNFCMHL